MKKHQVLLLLFSILNVATLKAKVEIASIFNDNMVLQQQMDVNIWGTDRKSTRLNSSHAT